MFSIIDFISLNYFDFCILQYDNANHIISLLNNYIFFKTKPNEQPSSNNYNKNSNNKKIKSRCRRTSNKIFFSCRNIKKVLIF